MSVLPVGGLAAAISNQNQPDLPASPDAVELPQAFANDHNDDSLELLVIGESSAAGVPYDWWLSVGSLVTWQLEKFIPGRRFHVTTLAASGATLELQHQRLAD